MHFVDVSRCIWSMSGNCKDTEGEKKMPVGNPSAQTIASKKYQEKAGYISKSYKLKKEVVEEFSKACERMGVSQAQQITQMMKDYIEKTKKE